MRAERVPGFGKENFQTLSRGCCAVDNSVVGWVVNRDASSGVSSRISKIDERGKSE